MEYPKCSNDICKHNNQYYCTSKRLNEDIICKQGKADAIKKIKCSKSMNKKLKL
jgi:hypothetical protein